MTNLQFIALLSPALGSLVLVVLAWIHGNSRITDLRADTNRQFEAVTREFEAVSRKFEAVDRQFESVNGRLESLNVRIDGLGEQLATRASSEQVATLAADFRNFYGMEQKLEGRVDELSKRIA